MGAAAVDMNADCMFCMMMGESICRDYFEWGESNSHREEVLVMRIYWRIKNVAC